jgi:FAD-dependent urate hydroxylase
MTVRKTLVIGGGIGGPVAAMALQRAGIQATVYEATEVPADYAGLFLNTSSNGLDVLRTLGIDVTRRADGFPMPQMVMWSGTGKRLGEVANGVRLPHGTVSLAIKRGLLQRVLRQGGRAPRHQLRVRQAAGHLPGRRRRRGGGPLH